MSALKRFLAVFILLCILLSFCSCGGTGADARIYFSLEKMPETLDPQVASSDSELLVCRNIYEGLIRQNEKGEIVPGAAKSYEFSSLTYTFTLRENLRWSDGEPLKAEDFVFGIKRALSPETRAPFARLLYAIAGAAEFNSGKKTVTPASALGISAPDDKTVVIKLAYDDKNFLKALSMPVSMPCRKEFFIESTGKYGLEKDCVLSNGSYRLARWNKEDFGIRLYKNDEYTGTFKPKNGGVFISRDKEKSVSEKLLSGDSDIALLSAEYLPEIKAQGIKETSVQNICWILSLGGDFNENIRRALLGCISADVYGKILPVGFTVANSFFPGCLNAETDDMSYHLPYDPTASREIISKEIKGFENKKFPQTTLIYANTEPLRPVITEIVGDWQKNLSTFINIKPTDKSLEGQLLEQTLPISVFPVKAESTTEEYIYKFNDKYYKGYRFMPIAFEETTLGYRDNLNGVYMNYSGGYIDFSYVTKK